MSISKLFLFAKNTDASASMRGYQFYCQVVELGAAYAAAATGDTLVVLEQKAGYDKVTRDEQR